MDKILKNFTLCFFLLLTPLVSGCSTNPATGDQSFTGLMSLDDEKRIGREEHPKILKTFGGRYKNLKIQNYINQIGYKLAKRSELPNIKWTFTVLNSPAVNAFALPGGYIYVTRGLMALASSEAEIAGVIAHEIAHVTARHTAQRYSGSILAGGLSAATSILFGSAAGEIANFASKAAIKSYSRKQEFEADTLGVRYLSRCKYNSRSMATFLNKLRGYSRLQAKIHKKDPSRIDQFDMFATHPRTLDRVERAIANTKQRDLVSRTGTIDYMANIHNIIYGDDPKEGFVKGHMFVHPELRFQFKVPRSFRIFNSSKSVIARGPNSSFIKFDMAPEPYNGPMKEYIQNVWARNTVFQSINSIEVNGMLGSTASKSSNLRNGLNKIKLVVLRHTNTRIFRFLFVSKARDFRRFSSQFWNTINSLLNISYSQAKKFVPYRLKVKAVKRGDTVRSFARQMSVNYKEETFRVINGLRRHDKLRPGQLVKIISE